MLKQYLCRLTPTRGSNSRYNSNYFSHRPVKGINYHARQKMFPPQRYLLILYVPYRLHTFRRLLLESPVSPPPNLVRICQVYTSTSCNMIPSLLYDYLNWSRILKYNSFLIVCDNALPPFCDKLSFWSAEIIWMVEELLAACSLKLKQFYYMLPILLIWLDLEYYPPLVVCLLFSIATCGYTSSQGQGTSHSSIEDLTESLMQWD